MRAPTISNYVNATYRLGNLTSSLQDANRVISTQKQLNEVSDDPLGLSQVLSLKDSLGNLEQIERNVITGKSWIESVENALDGVNDLMLSAKVEVARLANDSTTDDERRSAIERVTSYIEQIVSLGNTQINGNYIFGGTDIDAAPFEYDKTLEQVIYNGNDPAFEIRSDKNSEVSVGRSGKESFWDQEIHINSTNDTILFKEDNGHGIASEKRLAAVVPEGVYTKSQLVTAIKNGLNAASADRGYNLTYEVDWDEETQKFAIRQDGSYPGYVRTTFLWESGKEPHIEGINASSAIDPDDISINVVHKDALTIKTPEPAGTEPFRLTWNGDNTWTVDNNPGYFIVPSTIPGTAGSVGIDLDNSGIADIQVSLDTPVSKPGQFVEFDIVPAGYDQSIGHEIGFAFDDTVHEPAVSDTSAQFVTELVIEDGVNDHIVFEEVDAAGVATTLTADINTTGVDLEYTDMDELAQDIETQMEAVSANGINYAVTYDSNESRFIIRENGTTLDELNILWSSSAQTEAAGETLGFYPHDDAITYPVSDNTAQAYITIDDTNDTVFFRETGGITRVMSAKVAHGTYTDMSDLEAAVESAMNARSAASGNAVTYDLSYDDAARQFELQRSGGGALAALDLLWKSGGSPDVDNSIGETLGFTTDSTGLGVHTSDTEPVLMSFDDTNNVIDFRETAVDGSISEEIQVRIEPGDYIDLDDVASQVQTAMRDASPNGVRYTVDYDYAAGQFMIKGSSQAIRSFSLLWQTGTGRDQSADERLGFYGDDVVSFSKSDIPVVNLTIDADNNKLDFKEYVEGDMGKEVDQLTAVIKEDTYKSHDHLAREIEKALEEKSYADGNKIDYTVTWDDYTQKFSIKENGTKLEQLDLMWKTGDNAPLSQGGTGQGIGSLLGFHAVDDEKTPMKSDREVEWGIFNTLIDLKTYLADNDRDGIERTIGRLEQNFDIMTSRIVDAGMKFSRLEVRETITSQVGLSLTERRSMIEDADIVEAIMKLKNIETAYQAALNSTSKILDLSLVNYL